MHIERLHKMMECLTEKALSELESGIEHIDTCEFGAVTDILKDLAEAEYYAKISVAMDEADAEEIMDMFDRYGDDRRYYDHYRYKNGRFAPKGHGTYRRGYEEPPYYRMMPYKMTIGDYKEHDPEYWRDKDRDKGIMYYTEPMDRMMHDTKDGKSWKTRRGYMESKELHKDNTPESKQAKMKELEKYMSELSEDVTEMIANSSQEERNLLKQKLQVLTQKIG